MLNKLTLTQCVQYRATAKRRTTPFASLPSPPACPPRGRTLHDPHRLAKSRELTARQNEAHCRRANLGRPQLYSIIHTL